MLNKEDLMKVLPLSCVESYFSAWLADCGCEDSLLYGRSFVSLPRLMKEFATEDKSYERYDGIERLMKTAEDYGMTKHTVYNSVDIQLIKGKLADNGLVLMEVNKEFFGNYALRPWRNDHYIAITQVDAQNQVSYLNQYPLSDGELSAEELLKCFGGRVLCYEVMGGLIEQKFLNDENILFEQIRAISTLVADSYQIPLKAFRDCVGILRMTRKRLQRWLRLVGSMGRFLYDETLESFFDDYLSVLDLSYMRAEAAILRKQKAGPVQYNDVMVRIGELEEKWIALIKNRRLKDERAEHIR